LRKITWTDEDGWDRTAYIRDSDSEDVARKGAGISADPPDMRLLSCDDLLRDLHNGLVARGLVTYEDVMKAQNGVSAVIKSVLKRKIIELYRGGNHG